jgi:hypothetical protein
VNARNRPGRSGSCVDARPNSISIHPTSGENAGGPTRNSVRKGLGHGLVAYDPEFIDLFFVIDGDLAMYLIPSRAVASRLRILLRTYKKYMVGNAAGLVGASTGAGVVRESA